MLGQRRSSYSSDLTDAEWNLIQDLIPDAKSGGRPRKHDLKEIVSAVLYLNRSGCSWRYLPKEFPPWQTVYRYFKSFCEKGIWQKVLILLVEKVRSENHLAPVPKNLIIDAQSVRAHYGESRGYDGFKKVRGRKREILVESMGFVVACASHAANEPEARCAEKIVSHYRTDLLGKPKSILGDSAYGKSPFDVEIFRAWGFWPKTVLNQKQNPLTTNLRPRRWIVERSFAWLNNFRRCSRDYERTTWASEAQVYIANLQLALHRIAPG